MMARPVSVPPVKVMALTSGCATMAAPARAPRPCTMLSAPGGNPASRARRPSNHAVVGASSLGLATTVQPAASAGAIFQVNK